MHISTPLVIAFLALLSPVSALTGTVAPFPIQTCASSGGAALVQTACPSNTSRCCGVGAACCAGGCCPLNAVCANAGKADEACCPVTDRNLCGAAPSSSTATASCVPGPQPSKQCVSANADWYCAPGASCGLTRGSCFGGYVLCAAGAGGMASAGTGSSSSFRSSIGTAIGSSILRSSTGIVTGSSTTRPTTGVSLDGLTTTTGTTRSSTSATASPTTTTRLGAANAVYPSDESWGLWVYGAMVGLMLWAL